MPGEDADANAGDRNLSGAGEAECDHERHPAPRAGGCGKYAGRKSPHNHAQTARNLRRSLRSAAAGARLIQPEAGQQIGLLTSQRPLAMPSKSFTGSSAALIDASDATQGRRAGTVGEASSPHTW